MWTSFLCAVHCALLPLALAVLPTLGLSVVGRVDIDQAFVVFATVLAVAALAVGYRRHRAFLAWLLLAPGLVLVWANAFSPLHDHSLWHAVMMAAGGLLIAAAHLVNYRLSHLTAPDRTA
ncbi:MAG: MerC domain-containing protein [Chiayiivirga sp.]|nr:MerC domain-containing protein [Chiayiivirga sp.]MEB2314648.1 MerC domain-containing protein [Xanthomonadaceae bacterium]